MDRRTLLAAVAATAFSTAALTGAVAATTHLFTAGEAAAGVGTISPVSSTTLPPIVEHKVLDIEDPAPAAAPTPAPAPAPTTSTRTVREDRVQAAPAIPTTAAAPAVTAAPAPPPVRPPDGFEPGDD